MTLANPSEDHSPDEADSMIMALMCAVRRLGFSPGKKADMSTFVQGEDRWAVKIAFREGRMEELKAQESGRMRPVLAPEFSESFD